MQIFTISAALPSFLKVLVSFWTILLQPEEPLITSLNQLSRIFSYFSFIWQPLVFTPKGQFFRI